MTGIHEEKFSGPKVWDAGTEFPNDGIAKLDDTCLTEIETLAEALRANPLPTEALLPEDFDMPACKALMADVRQTVDNGTGSAVVERLDVDAIEIYLDDLLICQQGGQASTYDEQQAMKIMSQQDISVTIDLQRGSVDERVWTSDLSLDYVHINADYRS